MDKQTQRLLDILVKACGDTGASKILEVADLIAAFPTKYRPTPECIQSTIKYLADLEMVDVRHSDDQHVAIAILPRGRIYKEERSLQKETKRIGNGILALIIFGSFLAAFAASLLANVVVNSFWN